MIKKTSVGCSLDYNAEVSAKILRLKSHRENYPLRDDFFSFFFLINET